MTFKEWEAEPLPKKMRSIVDDWKAERTKLIKALKRAEREIAMTIHPDESAFIRAVLVEVKAVE